MAKFLALDGTPGTYASTPNSEAVDITGDIAVVARLKPNSWAGAQEFILSTYPDGFRFNINGNGIIEFEIPRSDGGREQVRVGSGSIPNQDVPVWLAATWRLNDGNGEAVGAIHYSYDGANWQDLVETRAPAISSLRPSSSPLAVGGHPNGTAFLFSGEIYRAQVYSGAGFDLSSGPTGTLAADFNPADAPDYAIGGDSFQSALTGETWTLHGDASIGGVRTVISDDMVLDPHLPRPSVCLTAMAKREVHVTAVWRECR